MGESNKLEEVSMYKFVTNRRDLLFRLNVREMPTTSSLCWEVFLGPDGRLGNRKENVEDFKSSVLFVSEDLPWITRWHVRHRYSPTFFSRCSLDKSSDAGLIAQISSRDPD